MLKNIQNHFENVKDAIFLNFKLRLNESSRCSIGQSLQQNCFFSSRCVYLGRGLGIFPTITPKCLTGLAGFVIVEVL